MLRIPNPGSNIDSFINTYLELFKSLQSRKDFNLDDMSSVLVEKNLAASSGYVGARALAVSTRKDRSRDPLYNQSKMYSELYKMLGWLHPTEDAALRFRFTFLGYHAYRAYRDPKPIFKQSLLGVVYPNAILDVKGNHNIRPFVTLLKTCSDLGGFICRDEMIIGPLSLNDDRDTEEYEVMINSINRTRGNLASLQGEILSLRKSRKISYNTMQNYTRFPIAVLKWTGWAEPRRMKVYEKSMAFLQLTEKGAETLRELANYQDFRSIDLNDYHSTDLKEAIVRLAFFQMLERAKFDLSENSEVIDQDIALLKAKAPDNSTQYLFSPFQDMPPQYLEKIFPSVMGSEEVQKPEVMGDKNFSKAQVSSTVTLAHEKRVSYLDNEIENLFVSNSQDGDVNQAVEYIFSIYAGTDQNVFYPFIEKLFQSLGYDCVLSRTGVNYERWDALIRDSKYSIPIEIKSPGEEEFISLKAIRQALENKVILLSREAYPTTKETTSLVVGYDFPNDRSEAMALVEAFHGTYGISIGVLDLRALLNLVGEKIFNSSQHDEEELRTLLGFADVKTS